MEDEDDNDELAAEEVGVDSLLGVVKAGKTTDEGSRLLDDVVSWADLNDTELTVGVTIAAVVYTKASSSSRNASPTSSQHVVFTVPLLLYSSNAPVPQHHLPVPGHWNTSLVSPGFPPPTSAHCFGQAGSLKVGSVQPMRQYSLKAGFVGSGLLYLQRPLERQRSVEAQQAECLL